MKPITRILRVVVGWRHKCPECKTNFDHDRPDQITCSPRCRQRRKIAGRSGQPLPGPGRPATVKRIVEVLQPSDPSG